MDSHVVHEIELLMLYTKVNSRVTRKFCPSNSTKIRVAARECQLRRELCRIYTHTYIYIYNIILYMLD